MSLTTVLTAAGAGLLAGPWLRGLVFGGYREPADVDDPALSAVPRQLR